MVTIGLHNTAKRVKEDFSPIDAQNVRMYVCGPTVYDRAHLGNARPVVVFDVLFRLLRHVYGAEHVTYVRNFTDVDDKINATAQARKAAGDARSLEALIRERTEETISWYHADMDALGALRPTMEPRATEYITEMQDMIQILIDKGHAYTVRDPSNHPPKDYVLFNSQSHEAEHALFSVESDEDYGVLSGRSVADMIAGARVEVAPYKRHPADFVLWKPSDDDLPGWKSAWGRGRPGWHIECSAMSRKLLGGDFDIHGGGLDLQFPHHENEIAQSHCAHPDEGFAKVWMHNEMLQVEGKKMSKSLGNFFTVRDLLEQGVPPKVLRMVFLGTHYRKPMDYTVVKASQFQNELHKWSFWMANFAETKLSPSVGLVAALSDDLNTPEALTQLRRLFSEGQYEQLAADAKFLNVWNGESPSEISRQYVLNAELPHQLTWAVDDLLRKLDSFRADKNFAAADHLKDALKAVGVDVRFEKMGTTYQLLSDFDPAKLEALK